MNEESFSLIDVLKILIKKWKSIITGTLIAAVITAIVSFIIPKTYKATASLIIWESKIGSDGVLSNYFNPRYYYSFEGIVKNKDLAYKVIKKFNLDAAPYDMTTDDLLENIKVSLLRNSKVIELNVYFKDADKSAQIANFLADEAVELNNQLNIKDVLDSRITINNQLMEAKKNLDESEKKLADFKAFARTKELETEIEILLYKLADLEIRNLDLSIKADSKKNEDIDEQIKDAKKALEEFRTSSKIEMLSTDIEALKDIRKDLLNKISVATGEEKNRLEKHLSDNEQQISSIESVLSEKEIKYTTLQDNFDRLRNILKNSDDKSLSSLKKEIKSIENKTSDTKTLLAQKQKLLAERETQLETLTLKYETDQQLFKKIKSKYEEATLKIAEKSQDIRIIDHAHTPTYPEYPKKKLMVIIASVLAFLSLCIFFLIKERLTT